MYLPKPTRKQIWSVYASKIFYATLKGLFISVLLNLIVVPVLFLVNLSNYIGTIALVLTGIIISLFIIWNSMIFLAYKNSKPETFNRAIVKKYNPSLILYVVEKDTGKGIKDLFVEANHNSNTRTEFNGEARFVLEDGEYDIEINQAFKNDDYKGKTVENVEVDNNKDIKKVTVKLDENTSNNVLNIDNEGIVE